MIILYGTIALILVLVVYFALPSSRLRTDFNRDTAYYEAKLTISEDVFTEKEIESLPLPVQNYFRRCGFIGTEKMSVMKAGCVENVDSHIKQAFLGGAGWRLFLVSAQFKLLCRRHP